MPKPQSAEDQVRDLRRAVEIALQNLEYGNAYCWVFGVTAHDVPARVAMLEMLVQRRAEFMKLAPLIPRMRKMGKRVTLPNLEQQQAAAITLVRMSEEDKALFKSAPIKVLCSEPELLQLAVQVKRDGPITITKPEVDRLFDFTSAIKFWDRVPDYTLVHIGGGLGTSSPEFDVFEAMCWCYDKALLTHRELADMKTQQNRSEVELDQLNMKLAEHSILCRQTLINAFLLVEAYINSIAYAAMHSPKASFTPQQTLYLNERRIDKNGQETTKFVAIEDKLVEWVKTLSPTGTTFNKGRKPFQEFMKLKDYRDAIVHLAAPKVAKFLSINWAIAESAGMTALDMVKKITEYTSSDGNNVEYPFWLKEPAADGLFHVSRTIEVNLKPIT